MEMFSTKCDKQKYVQPLNKFLEEMEMSIRVTHMYANFDFDNDNSSKNNANLSRYFEKTY